ncbi:MAG: succinylglutamate desuccinylase/aspartoacylase family protein [Methanoregulaceae archaeon]|nr:succinylglutamate desuccinylase/aspartoacylase family protein [Methanoregulaceae archaeon]
MDAIGSGIWQAKGPRHGVHIVVLGGVHGDEKTGIDVVRKLHALFTAGDEHLAAGTLTLVLGNEEAIRLIQRGTSVEHNLNRLFTEKHLAGPVLDFYESRRAHQLAPLLASANVSIDLHSTSSPSSPFLPCAFSPRHERIYRWFSCDLVLTDPDYILGGERATTDEYVDSCGGAGICFETGFAGDTSRAPAVFESIKQVLADVGLIIPARPLSPPEPDYRVYRIVRRIFLSPDGFSYAAKFPESFQPVQKGEVIGYHGTRPEIAEEEGVIVFPKARELWHPGHDIFFLARRIR